MSEIIKSNYYEVIDGTTMYYEDYVEQLQQANKELKEQIKLFKKDLAKAEETCQKYNSRYYDENLILTKFEKWLEKKIQENAIAQSMTIGNLPEYVFLKECQYGLSKEYYIFNECLDKLQELKEGNNAATN